MSVDRKNKVDVLTVGAGPAGLMAANWMAQLGVSFRIIDKRGTEVYNGQADGLHSRTVEIFDSFGLADKVRRDGGPLSTVNAWNPDKDGVIQRAKSMQTSGNFLSRARFSGVALHQGHIESLLMGAIAEKSGVQVERGVLPESLEVDTSLVESDTEHPIRVRLRHLNEGEATPKDASTQFKGQKIANGLFRSNLTADDTADILRQPRSTDSLTEEVEAKYLLGCDGAHSWVRNQLGFKLEGESTDFIWGVLDAKVVTNFPDARLINMIQSAEFGNILWIPREAGLLRIYIQLSKVNKSQDGTKFDRSSITPELIIEQGKKIMRPFKVEFPYVDWWTVYQVGQRVADHFSFHNRVFLAGDAVHTHSPKAGQGMNVSMGDTYNLGWKLASVLHGTSHRSLLSTYEFERRKVAQDLIAFDTRISRLMSGGTDPVAAGHISKRELLSLYKQNLGFMSGLGITYLSSPITLRPTTEPTPPSSDDEADAPPRSVVPAIPVPDIPIGQRVPDVQLVSQFSDTTYFLHQLLRSTGHWRILLFPGDLQDVSQLARFRAVCERLNAPGGLVRRFTPADGAVDAVVQVYAVHHGSRGAAADFEWPAIVRAFRGWEDGWDYGKVFVDDHGCETYARLGIEVARGCAVVVRPDAYVSWVGEVDDYEAMDRFFAGFMRVQEREHKGAVALPEGWADEE